MLPQLNALILVSLAVLVLVSFVPDATALRQVAGEISLDLKPGQTDTIHWGLVSDNKNDVTTVEISAKGNGAEFLSFAESYTIEPARTVMIPVTITIPDDYPGDITLAPKLYATEFGETGGATVINIQMLKILSLNIQPNDDQSLLVDWAELDQDIIEKTVELDVVLEMDKDIPQGLMISQDDEKLTCGAGTELVDGFCKVTQTEEKGGGCLIATATYGTELATQVQLLREIRDSTLYSTESGSAFMELFNLVYYSFSPYIADMQRENQTFREATKILLTPMISSLSVMALAQEGSESHIIGFGVSVILLNGLMYIGAPAITLTIIKRRF